MHITGSSKNKIALSDGTGVLQCLAAGWLWLEAILCWLAPVFMLGLVMAVLALWGVLEKTPLNLQLIFTATGWMLATFFLVREFPKVPWPNAARIKSRLEQAGALHHQPLQTLADAPMRRNPLSDALWQHHQLHAAGLLAQLRWPKLRTHYVARDPIALRWLLILLGLLGILYAPELAVPRLAAVFIPTQSNMNVLAVSEFYLYFTPPDYSGLKPVFISRHNRASQRLIFPTGTVLWVRVSGGAIKPVFKLDDEEKKLSRVQDGFFVLQTRLDAGRTIQIRQGIFPLLTLPIEIQPPAPPTITVQNITPAAKGMMHVDLCARDHYALQNVTLHWQKDGLLSQKEIPAQGRKFCDNVRLDVASDILAGQNVQFWATAQNSAGLENTSMIQNITLASYDFRNPAAARLAAARQAYGLNPRFQGELQKVLAELRAGKLSVGLFLAVQNVQDQLKGANRTLDEKLQADLWQIAMRLEEGENADIAANWRAARDDLAAALSNWQLPEEIIEQRLARAAVYWHDDAPAHGIDPNEFSAFWQAMASDVASGQRDHATKMLAQIDISPEFARTAVDDSNRPEKMTLASALQQIRARLGNATTSPEDRNYLELLVNPKR